MSDNTTNNLQYTNTNISQTNVSLGRYARQDGGAGNHGTCDENCTTIYDLIDDLDCQTACVTCVCAVACMACYVSVVSIVSLASVASVFSVLSVFSVCGISLTISIYISLGLCCCAGLGKISSGSDHLGWEYA